MTRKESKNVLGGRLDVCSGNPKTGFYRNGCCDTGGEDVGGHVVCVQVTSEFLEFSLQQGNDLVTPVPDFGFPGLKAGDRWCVCAARWKEALGAGVAPPLFLKATHEVALEIIDFGQLIEHAIDVQ